MLKVIDNKAHHEKKDLVAVLTLQLLDACQTLIAEVRVCVFV